MLLLNRIFKDVSLLQTNKYSEWDSNPHEPYGSTDFPATLAFTQANLPALPLVFCLESTAVYTVVPKKG